MAGMDGFSHKCTDKKYEIESYRLTLRDSELSIEDCDLIWDFYVAKSFAASTGNRLSIEAYGWKDTTSKTDGYPALEDALAANAGIAEFCIIRSATIKDTLAAMDLSNSSICISHPRAVMLQDFHCTTNENENMSIKSDETRINALFRHIRNAFAHGNTFFFDNGMCLLKDKNNKLITAAILIPQRSLTDWIYIIDRNGKFYKR